MAYYALVTPYWFLVFLAMVIPVVWLRRSPLAAVANAESPTNHSATKAIRVDFNTQDHKHQKWQFSLRTLLVGVLVVSVGLSWLRTVVYQTAPHGALVVISGLWPLGLFLRFVRHGRLFKKTRTRTAAIGG